MGCPAPCDAGARRSTACGLVRRGRTTWPRGTVSPTAWRAQSTTWRAHDDPDQFARSAGHTVATLDRLVGVRPSDTILEIGCGVGRVGAALGAQCEKWIGTDISGKTLTYAGQRLRDLDNVELVELRTVGLAEIPDETVDLVYSPVVFMHLSEWDRFRYVSEAHRVLRPGGRCYFDDVDITSGHGQAVFSEGYDMRPDDRPAHISMTSSGDELLTYVTRAGFDDTEVHRWDDAWVAAVGVEP